MTKGTPLAYLAGPALFSPEAGRLYAEMKKMCARHGLDGRSPLDDVALDAATIRQLNQAKIRAADCVLADVGPFRGPNADDGTAWEMGYAEALGKLVVPYTTDRRTYLDRAVWFLGAVRHLEGAPWEDMSGQAVEDFGLTCNLMLSAGPVPVQPDFESAAKLAARLLRIGK
jgi:nucleoside 2-deoxyribosyltransferase